MKKIVVGFVCVLLFLFCGQKTRKYLAEKSTVEKYNRFVSETQECLDSREWKCAERNVRHLLEKMPSDTNLQLHLAGILFEEERYEECMDYIAGLKFRHPDLEFLSQKSAMLLREMHKLGIKNSGHFRLELEGRFSRKDVMEVLSVLEIAYDSLGGLFHFYPEDKFHVVLYQSSEYQGIGPRPDWVGAVFDGKIRVPVGMMQVWNVYRPMLFHELTHAFVRAMTRAKIPLWLNEGIAQVIDASRTGEEKPPGNPPTIQELTEPFVNRSSRADAEKLYWYSERMVQVLLENSKSAEPFREFRDCLRDLQRLGIDASLEKHFGMTSEKVLSSI